MYKLIVNKPICVDDSTIRFNNAMLSLLSQTKGKEFIDIGEHILSFFDMEQSISRDYAVKFIVGLRILFDKGDNLLDEVPQKSALMAQALDLWLDLLCNQDTKLRQDFEQNTINKNSLPDLGSLERNADFLNLCKLCISIKEIFDLMLENLKPGDRVHISEEIRQLFFQIQQGEHATFSLVDKLKSSAPIESYFQDICIDGNTPSFLLIYYIINCAKGDYTKVSKDEIKKIDEMAIYYQTTDDFLDSEEDTLMSQPKAAFFALKEMANISNNLLAEKPIDSMKDNPWYTYISRGLGNKNLSINEVLCSSTGDNRELLQQRINQWNAVSKILNRQESSIIEYENRIELNKIASEIDFMPVVKKVAYSFLDQNQFPEGNLGALCKFGYKQKLERLFDKQ